ncbi:MAG: diphthine synthase [Candidatus Bathyarchaeota archaeon]|nr:diphthine synthase [Candidatus Bathyarchaeota archaeon]
MWQHLSLPPQGEIELTLTLISIGLTDHTDLSQRALQAARGCDILYAELYTMILDTNIDLLSEAIGKKVIELPRGRMEDSSYTLIEEARQGDIGVLVGGDALTATTHVSLILEATHEGIPTRVVHGSSIITAVAEAGLSPYKFGRTVTLPLPNKAPPDTVLTTLRENREYGLHTLILLDLDTVNKKAHTIKGAIKILLNAEQPETYRGETLTVGIARLGWTDQEIKADFAKAFAGHDLKKPPHALIIPGRLHFHEIEALRTLAACPEEVLELHKPVGELDRLIKKYSESCRRVIQEFNTKDLPRSVTLEGVKALTLHAANYLNDGEYYQAERKATALASVSYAEGILDTLRLLGLVEFKW